jgi:hypothetical protein
MLRRYLLGVSLEISYLFLLCLQPKKQVTIKYIGGPVRVRKLRLTTMNILYNRYRCLFELQTVPYQYSTEFVLDKAFLLKTSKPNVH